MGELCFCQTGAHPTYRLDLGLCDRPHEDRGTCTWDALASDARADRGLPNELTVELHDAAPMFRHRSSGPYSKDTLGDDFRDVRALVYGLEEKRQLMDMRRSGAVEALAGDASAESLSAKMGNTIDDSKALRRTCLPVDMRVVGLADAARLKGRSRARGGKG